MLRMDCEVLKVCRPTSAHFGILLLLRTQWVWSCVTSRDLGDYLGQGEKGAMASADIWTLFSEHLQFACCPSCVIHVVSKNKHLVKHSKLFIYIVCVLGAGLPISLNLGVNSFQSPHADSLSALLWPVECVKGLPCPPVYFGFSQ